MNRPIRNVDRYTLFRPTIGGQGLETRKARRNAFSSRFVELDHT